LCNLRGREGERERGERETERERERVYMHENFKAVIYAFGGTSCMVTDTESLSSDTAEHRKP